MVDELRLPVDGDVTEMNEVINAIPLSRAVEYIRTSSEHPKHTTENQLNVIRCYAEAHNIEIVRTYSDQDKANSSGRVDK
jgi:hypothetical protein